MLRHSILLIYRNFKVFKSTFFINLIGLSTGLACTLLIYLWVYDEINFDKFHKNDSRLFQVMEHHKNEGWILTREATPDPLAEALAEHMPEVEYAATVTPFDWFPKFTVSIGSNNFRAEGKFAGKDFFKIFSYELTQGNESQVLTDRNAMVITESLAKRLFNTTQNIIGKSVKWEISDFKKECFIAGIVKDIPANSSDRFDFVMPMDSWREMMPGYEEDFDGWGPNTYLLLKNGTNIDEFNNKINRFLKSKSNNAQHRTLFVKPYSENYLYGKYENGVQTGGRIEYVRLFSIIAVFILIIACINFMNLSTAKASRRIKEVGIKKAMGAQRRTLVLQYLGESMLMAFLSLFAALVLVQLFLPHFSDITGKSLILEFHITVISTFMGITLFTGLAAGSYPALYLSGFNPAFVLKGKFNSSGGELWARKGLVIFQFTLSIIFIVSVIVIYKQIEFVQTKKIGYDKDNIIYFGAEGRLAKNFDTFISEIKNIPEIVNASSMIHYIVGNSGPGNDTECNGKKIPLSNLYVNYGLIETLGIEMGEGRPYSRDFSDRSSIIFNQAAIDLLGLDNPVGQVIKVNDDLVEIIGVTKNFHFQSLHEPIRPLAIRLDLGRQWNIMVKIKAGKEEEAITKLQKFHQKYNPGFTFDYKFLDHDYRAQYAAEKRVASLSKYFAAMAILISCLGLFGLAAFTAERRTKEIGIRKVLGSTAFGIIQLLSGDFTKIVLASIIFALPLSYLIARYWLDNFAYRIPLELWYFISAGLAAILIAWLTVGIQALKASKINPSECLRSE